MSFILVFDIPREMQTLKRQVNRQLIRINAEMIQFSIWKCKNLKQLIDVATWIKRAGGEARILEEKFIF